MRLDRHHQQRLEKLANLHALKATASHADLIAKQSASQNARSVLSEREAIIVAVNGHIDSLFASEKLDLAALKVSSAVLDAATNDQASAANDLRSSEEKEDRQRRQWNLDRQREDQADRLHQKARRSIANRRDEAASAEAVDMQIARKNARKG